MIFYENGKIDEEKFEEYVMQEDNECKWKGKLRIASANMVGQNEKNKSAMYWSPRGNKMAQGRKHRLRARGGILIPSHAFGTRKLQESVRGGRITSRIRNLTINIGPRS